MSDKRKVTLSVDDAISIRGFLHSELLDWEADGRVNGLLHDALVDLIRRVDAQIAAHKNDGATSG